MSGDWIDAPREVTDRINRAVRDLQDAEDNITRLPTWEHLSASVKKVQEAADRLVAVVAETCPTPPGGSDQ